MICKYYLCDQIEKNEMSEACSTYGERRSAYRVLGGKPEGKSPLGRLGRRWEDNIKMDLQEVEWGHGQNRSGSGYGQIAGTCKRSNEPSGSIKFGEFLD
jgi:hypothetical protein